MARDGIDQRSASFESQLTLQAAYDHFCAAYPEFAGTRSLDAIRERELARLDRERQVYLDYTAAGLYADSQVRRHQDLLRAHVFGNPHSSNPTSQLSTDHVEHCRRHVLEFFNASPDEYVVIFTANASQALKLVGEAYPFTSESEFLLTFDNHNSVNGIREFARARGAHITYLPIEPPDMRADEVAVAHHLERPAGRPGLFAFPAQSNFSGVQHPLEWIERAQAHRWDVLLDAAAWVPTNRLDLNRWRPDFVALSFYKMFGYPTGVGALIARHAALEKFHRPWFAGGTITVASVQADRYYLAAGPAGFEDGTLNFLSLPAIDIGLDFIESIGLPTIHSRVRILAAWLLETLLALRHHNGRPLVIPYGPRTTEGRGATIAMNFQKSRAEMVDHQLIERLAADRGISLRTGCFCNPGAGEKALGLSEHEMIGCLHRADTHMTLHDFRRCIDHKSTGAVRISLGFASNFADVYAFVEFARSLLE